jgi:uncharacterized protein
MYLPGAASRSLRNPIGTDVMKRPVTATLFLLACSSCDAQSPAQPLPLETFQYDRTQPVDLTTETAGVEQGVTVQRISFASPSGGRVTGYLHLPPGSGPFAGIVVQHGMPSRARDMARTSLDLAARGAVVMAIDAPWARRGGPVLTWTAADSAEQVQLIKDLQRGVDILIARSDVDARRLAYVGVSYGGAMGALFAGIEHRLAAYVLKVGDGGLVAHFTGAEDPPYPDGLSSEQWVRWRAAMEPIEPMRFVGHAAAASIYFQSGEQDLLVPPADARRLHAAAGKSMKVSWYPAGHGLNADATADMLSWLEDRIALRKPVP